MNAEKKQRLFEYFRENHNITLLDGDFNEIEAILYNNTPEWLSESQLNYACCLAKGRKVDGVMYLLNMSKDHGGYENGFGLKWAKELLDKHWA